MSEKKKKPFDKKAFVIQHLRGAYRKTPAYHEAKNRAKREYFVESKHGLQLRRVHYECAICKRMFLDKKGFKEIAVDHILPVIDPDTGFIDWNTYIPRLLCEADNLWVLCNYSGERDGKKSCHKIKTANERAAAAAARKKLKENQ